MTYISEIFKELIAYSLILDAGSVVLVVVALDREKPVKVVSQLRAATGTGHKETSKVGEL